MKLKCINKVEKSYIEVDNKLTLFNLSDEVKNRLKELLTITNPAYVSAKRYSKWKNVRIPPNLTYFEENKQKNIITAPLGVLSKISTIPLKRDTRINHTLKDIPEFVLKLRPDQQKASDCFIEKNADPSKPCGLIQLPTGKGKSILGLHIAYTLRTPTLIIVHKTDLVEGWKKDIALAFNNKVKAGVIQAKNRTIGDFITIATVQTLNRLSEDMLEHLYSHFGLVIQDEVHHCPSTTFGVVDRFRARYKMGLTATPERTDGLTPVMNFYFGDFCFKFDKDRVSTEDKDILPFDIVKREVDNVYYAPMCKKSNNGYVITRVATNKDTSEPIGNETYIGYIDYKQRPKISYLDLDSSLMACEDYRKAVCEDIKGEFEQGHSCLAFMLQKEQCEEFKHYLIALGVPESYIVIYNGDTRNPEKVLDRCRSERKLITLTTFAKCTEGTNVKMWEVLFLVSSTPNGKNVEQALGRIRRVNDLPKLERVRVYDYSLPNFYIFSGHSHKRAERYRKLQALENPSGYKQPEIKSLFSRGFRK